MPGILARQLAAIPSDSSCCGRGLQWKGSRTLTMTVYSPKGTNTGVAVVLFPGGGYRVLAIDLEGTEVCDWLTSRGITAVLLKYPRMVEGAKRARQTEPLLVLLFRDFL